MEFVKVDHFGPYFQQCNGSSFTMRDHFIIYSLYCFDRSSSKTRSAVVLIRLPEDSGEDVDDDDDDHDAADGGVVLVAEGEVLLTTGQSLNQQDARGDHLNRDGDCFQFHIQIKSFNNQKKIRHCHLQQNGDGE